MNRDADLQDLFRNTNISALHIVEPQTAAVTKAFGLTKVNTQEPDLYWLELRANDTSEDGTFTFDDKTDGKPSPRSFTPDSLDAGKYSLFSRGVWLNGGEQSTWTRSCTSNLTIEEAMKSMEDFERDHSSRYPLSTDIVKDRPDLGFRAYGRAKGVSLIAGHNPAPTAPTVRV